MLAVVQGDLTFSEMVKTLDTRTITTDAETEDVLLRLRLRPNAEEPGGWFHVCVQVTSDPSGVNLDRLRADAESWAITEVKERLQSQGITAILPLVPEREFRAQNFDVGYIYMDESFVYPYGTSDSSPPSPTLA